MDVEDVRVERARFYNCQKGGNNGFDTLFTWREYINESNTTLFATAAVRLDVRCSPDNGNIMPSGGDAGIKLLAMRFDTAKDVRYTTSTDNNNFHGRNRLRYRFFQSFSRKSP